MRILQLSNKFPFPPRDGGSIAISSVAKGLSGLGHEITLLSMSTPKHGYKENSVIDNNYIDIRIEHVPIKTDMNVLHVFYNLLFSKLPYNATRFITKKYENRLINLLKKNTYDIVQIEGLYLMPYIRTIRQNSGAVIAYRAHNIEYEIWKRISENTLNPFKRFYLRIMAKRLRKFELQALNKYDLLIPITKRDANIFNEMGNMRPLHVCPAGIDLQKNNRNNDQGNFPSLFYIGSLDWMPNQEGLTWFLKNVWPSVRRKYPSVNFYLAGRNAPAWLIEKLKSGNANYMGEVADATAFIDAYSVMIVPLFSGSGMRVKIIEGMSLGKTVITTTTGAEGLNATHRKNILIADSSAEFINEIEFILNHPDECRILGSNARKFVETNFNNYKIISDLEKFYKKYLV